LRGSVYNFFYHNFQYKYPLESRTGGTSRAPIERALFHSREGGGFRRLAFCRAKKLSDGSTVHEYALRGGGAFRVVYFMPRDEKKSML